MAAVRTCGRPMRLPNCGFGRPPHWPAALPRSARPIGRPALAGTVGSDGRPGPGLGPTTYIQFFIYFLIFLRHKIRTFMPPFFQIRSKGFIHGARWNLYLSYVAPYVAWFWCRTIRPQGSHRVEVFGGRNSHLGPDGDLNDC